jgi:thiol-disulfide isomerase/thioredoxin
MKYLQVIILLLVFSCKDNKGSSEPTSEATQSSNEVEVAATKLPFEVYDYNGLKPLLHQQDDKIHVVNFWATWCAPCIKELPYFEKLQETYKENKIELLLVSLDFPRQYESKLVPFLKKREIKSKVVALDDVDQNRWIPDIDSTWTGAIPATIIYTGDQRHFYEQSFTYEELETELQKFLK